jgi:hypothetical protein
MDSRDNVYSLLAILTLACSIVFADGDSRKATPAEKDFGKLVFSVIAKALPPGPEGWEKTGDSTVDTDLKTLYTDVNKPLRIEYCAAWQNSKRMQEAQIQLNQELIKLAPKPGASMAQIEELQKKMEELQKKSELQDAKARIDLYTNITSQSLYDKASPATAIAGGLVYRTDGKYINGGWREGSTFVFLGGNWKLAGNYANFTPEKPAASSMVIQNIVVKIQADPKRADQFIQKIDWQALKALIK